VEPTLINGLTYREGDRELWMPSYEPLSTSPPSVVISRSDLRVWADGQHLTGGPSLTAEDQARVERNIEAYFGDTDVRWD
jgi:hypothetical protein